MKLKSKPLWYKFNDLTQVSLILRFVREIINITGISNLKTQQLIFIFTLCLLFFREVNAQKVGVVLSGGGAAGLAHIGVLMALEEEGIPIDYISGTSAGALVGAMYASGYSPEEITAFVLREDFLLMATGELRDDKKFMLRSPEPDASMLTIPFSLDSDLFGALPTNFITPAYLDFEMFRIFGITGAYVNDDFNQLFVPFRCVASDVRNKKAVVFREGKLNAAVRASMTFPFYVNPIRVDGELLFDGGLYNNFPADVLYEDFEPDYIIGSNVSSNAAPPKEDDLISQVNNMMITPTKYELPCENGVIISPEMDVSTFDFRKAHEAINAGYREAKLYIEEIRNHVSDTKDKGELNKEREKFRSSIEAIEFNRVVARNNNKEQIDFVEKSMMRDSAAPSIDMTEFEKRFFRIYATPQIKYIFPRIQKKERVSTLKLDVTKQKPFLFSAGGHFSSRPVNTGYLKLSYLGLGDGAIDISGENYFGKFYGSSRLKIDFDVPSKLPFRVSPYFTLNRWDYFRSFSTFFEDVKPSFLVQNELYYGTKISFPIGNRWKVTSDFRAFDLRDEYYQTEDFISTDTADVTNFDGQTFIFSLERNSLNRKQWASSGSYLKAEFRFVQGREQSVSGTTAPIEYDVRKLHQWINLKVEGQYFPVSRGYFRLGVHGKGVFNSQSLFANYTASILTMSEFSPLADAKTFFLEEYRAPQYIGAGLNLIFSLNNRVDFRFDPYVFQPFRRIERQEGGAFGYSDLFVTGSYMAAASVIWHSPVGPLRFTTNYFPNQSTPLSAQLSFGYVLFNERAIR